MQITTLIRICLVAGRIVSNPAFNNQARTRAAEVKCRHAETLRASSDRRFGLTQIKAASLRRMVARRIGERKLLHPSPQDQYDENADGDVIGNEHGVSSHPD